MVQKHQTRPPVSRRGVSLLSSLEPVDASPFKRPSSGVFVWVTIVLVWLLSLLPWRLWLPAPDLLLLFLAFWCMHEPNRVGLLSAFVFGVLLDVHDSSLLGGHALVYVMTVYGALALRRRLLHFNSLVQAVHMLPVFILAAGLGHTAYAWAAGEWSGWQWLWSAIFTAILWPLADILLLLPQRRLDDADAGSV